MQGGYPATIMVVGRSRSEERDAWPFKLSPLIRDFVLMRVPFVVVGGVAMARYVPSRVPKDLDLVIGSNRLGASRALRALERTLERNALVTASIDQPLVVAEQDLIEGSEIIVPTGNGVLHIVSDCLPVGISRDGLVRARQWVVIQRSLVPITSRLDLYRLKAATGLQKDREDCRLLSESTGLQPGISWESGGPSV